MVFPSAEVILEVPFHDVDMLHVVWHGHYYKYFEIARSALFQQCACDVPVLRELGYYMVVSDSTCRYINPLRYGMKFRVQATVVEVEHRLKIEYQITDMAGKRIARGSTTHVTVDGRTGALRFITPPEIVRQFSGGIEPPAALGETE